MTLVLSALPFAPLVMFVLLVFRINGIDGIPASIKPLDPTAVVGTDVTFRCVLNSSATTQSASDIIWYFKSYSNLIPRDHYEVEDNISRLHLRNVTFADSGAYYCAFESDGRRMWHYQGTMLRVGAPPSVPMGLRCHSTNMLDFWCEWRDGARNNLKTTYKFDYKQRYGATEWKDCPKLDARGKNTCFVSRHYNDGFNQRIRVTATNSLGSATAELNFNPGAAAVPNPPTAVEVTAVGPDSLRVTWGLPEEWDERHYPAFLQYRLEVTTGNEKHIAAAVPDLSHGEAYVTLRLYTVGDLHPYTRYKVRVAARTITAYSDDLWSPWTELVETRTAEAAPNAAVTELLGQEYDNTADPAYHRDVFLQWKDLPHANRRGKIVGYDVALRMILPDGSSEAVRTVRANGTMVLLENLEKFKEYYVDIAACNSVGKGPFASYFLADKTSEPGPPEAVRVQNISETSALVTWDRPTRPNGYIDGYYVEWRKGAMGDPASGFVEVNGTQTSCTIKGLETDRLYQFRVKAANSRGYSGWSNAPLQHMGGGSRIELLRTLINVLHNLLMDMGEERGGGNQVSLDSISTFL